MRRLLRRIEWSMATVVVVLVIIVTALVGIIFFRYNNGDRPGDEYEESYGICVKIKNSSTPSPGVVVNNVVVGSIPISSVSGIIVDLDSGERVTVKKDTWGLDLDNLCINDRVVLRHNITRDTYRLMEYGVDLPNRTE